MNAANVITVSRLVIAPFILLLGYVLRDKPFVLVAIIIFIALTDMVDGWVARTFNQTSKMGEVLDPASDKVLAFFTVLTAIFWFGFSWVYALLLLVRDLVLSAVFLWFMVNKKSWKNSTVKARFLGKLTTFLQQVTIIAAILSLPYYVIGVVLSCIVGIAAVIDYGVYAHAH